MDTNTYKYNRILLSVFFIAPFVGYVLYGIIGTDFNTVMQLFSFIGVGLIFVFKPKDVDIKIPRYLIFYTLFVLYVFLRDLYGLNREFKIMYLFKNFLVGGISFMFIIENIPFPKKYYRKLIQISSIVLVIAFVVILLQQAGNPNLFTAVDPETNVEDLLDKSDNDNRLYSVYSWIGGLVTVGFGFVPVFLLVIEDYDRRKKDIMLWLLIGLVFAFLTKARWIMLNTLPVFVLLFIGQKNFTLRLFKLMFLIPLVIYIGSMALTLSGIDPMGIVNERILEKGEKKPSAGTRILAFKVFGALYMDNPVVGAGNVKYGMGGTGIQVYKMRKILKGYSSQIHVGYLALLYRYGLIGGFFFLGFLYLILKRLRKNAKASGIWAPYLGFFGLVLANLTLVTFFTFEIGLLIVLIADRYYAQQIEAKKRLNA